MPAPFRVYKASIKYVLTVPASIVIDGGSVEASATVTGELDASCETATLQATSHVEGELGASSPVTSLDASSRATGKL